MLRCCYLLLCLVSALSLHGQAPQYFEHFTDKHGLSDNRVQTIIRDRQGYVWVGTANGLNRFDGYSFRQYFPDELHPERGPSQAFINQLLEDSLGRIWIATQDGLSRYTPRNGRFDSWHHIPNDPTGLPHPIVWNLFLDRQQRLWLSCENSDLLRYDEQSDRFVSYPWLAFVHATLPSLSESAYIVAYGMKPKDAHSFWINSNRGLFSYDWAAERFQHYPMPASFKPLEGHLECAETYINGSWENDILTYDPCKATWAQVLLPFGTQVKGGRRYVAAILPYNEGYCALTREGMFYLSRDFQQVTKVVVSQESKLEVPQLLLQAAFVDQEGALWTGGDDGLWLAKPQQKHFKYEQVKFREQGDFYNAIVRTIKLEDGRILALDFYGHALSLLASGKVVGKLDLPERANLLYQDRQGSIWVAGGNSLFQVELAPYRLQPYPIRDSAWQPQANGFFTDMTQDSHGHLWLGHTQSGLLIIDPRTQACSVPGPRQGFQPSAVNAVFADTASQTVWIGMQNLGLVRYDESRQTFTSYQHDARNPLHSLAANNVTGICRDHQGRIWISSDPGGLTRFDYHASERNAFISSSSEWGLPNRRVCSVVCDQKGRLWLGALGGLACVDPQAMWIRNFDMQDGLATEYLDLPLSVAATGEVFLGTLYGYQYFQPDSILSGTLRPEILLSSFKIFDREVIDSIDLKSFSPLSLNYEQNFFSFEFASSDVAAAGKTQYACRLQGFDKDWMALGPRHQASYTNVPPGDYSLELRAGLDGAWSPVGFRLPIHIVPAFWQTLWFKLLVALLIFAAIFGVYRFRISQIRREELLKTEFNRRIAQTEMAALRAQMNPHFVFNCLSSINRFILVNQPEEASNYLTKFSRLIRLILDNSRSEMVPLSKELEALKLYIEMEQMRFADRFTYAIVLDGDLQAEQLELPPLLIQPFVENAIWHGLMHKKGDCALSLRIFPDGDQLCIEIEDNGVGRARAKELKSKSATVQKSLGLKVTSERLEVIYRLYGTSATVETIDLEEDGQASGTLVRLRLRSLF